METKITSDPNDPKFREALRELGAPEWYPQDAPKHICDGSFEQTEDGKDIAKFVCPDCGYEKHFVEDALINVNEGDRWALHSGGTRGIAITNVEAQQKDYLEPYEGFLEELE